MPLKAVIFDFDGVILDTELPDYSSWQEVYTEHGMSLEIELWCQNVGRSEVFDACQHLEQLVGRALAQEEIRQRRRERCMEMIRRELPRPGVLRWLDAAAELGVPCAVASSSSRAWVEGHLRDHGLLERFALTSCREDVGRTKPAPDVYLSALERLGVRPSEAIAIEDSPHGVSAAKAAGIYCLAVPNDVTRYLSFEHADLVVESLERLDFLHLHRQHGQSPTPRKTLPAV